MQAGERGTEETAVNHSVCTHYHAMEGQLSVHFELIGRCDTFACVEEHV